MTGIFAFGYIIMSGTKTPWSYPLFVLVLSSTPSFASYDITWFLSSEVLPMG